MSKPSTSPDGTVCMTCADQALAARVLELLPQELAWVDIGTGVELISLALVDAAVGDMVLVHAKEAIANLTVCAKLMP
jgi:hydrogenase maturation factor